MLDSLRGWTGLDCQNDTRVVLARTPNGYRSGIKPFELERSAAPVIGAVALMGKPTASSKASFPTCRTRKLRWLLILTRLWRRRHDCIAARGLCATVESGVDCPARKRSRPSGAKMQSLDILGDSRAPLFLLLSVITVSFVPIFSLEAEEGASRRNGIRFRMCVFRGETADPADPLNYVISPSALG
jgi:hypothetical protein